MKQTAYIALVVLLGACEKSAPEKPDWVHDVQPILRAQCIRCHGVPQIEGAPATFRLDFYEDTIVDGRIIRGAGTMAHFIDHRAGAKQYDVYEGRPEGTMPPNGVTVSGPERDVLSNWFENRPDGDKRPPRGQRANEHPPDITLVTALASTPADQSLSITYQITDADHDAVDGQLEFGPAADNVTPLAKSLQSGRRTVVWDTGAVPAGSYVVTATITDQPDANKNVHKMLGTVVIAHPNGNTAPTVAIIAPQPDSDGILADDDGVIQRTAGAAPGDHVVKIVTSDPDAGDTTTVDLVARKGTMMVPIATAVAAVPGTPVDVKWNTAAVPEGTTWRIVATVSDGKATRTATSGELIVSHKRMDDASLVIKTWMDGTVNDARTFFNGYCTDCHTGVPPGVPDFLSEFGFWECDPDNHAQGMYPLRALIYRRVVQKLEMPLRSAFTINQNKDPARSPTPEARKQIGDWLLAGAPGMHDPGCGP